MVIQLGADRRDEFKGAARVLAEQQERDSLRDRALAAGHRRAALLGLAKTALINKSVVSYNRCAETR